MKITFLGTGTPAAMPVGACPCEHCDAYRRSGRTQYRPAVLVESHQTTVLLDLGPDIRQQAIKHGIRHLDAVFVTHAHRDHFGGLPELALLRYSGLRSPPIYVNEGVRKHAAQYFDWVQADFVVTQYGNPYTVGDLTVTCVKGLHGEHFECSILDVTDGTHRLVYMPDTRIPTDLQAWDSLRGPDLAVTDGSYAFGVLQDPLGIVDPSQFDDPTHPSTVELSEIWTHLDAGSVCLMHVSEHFTQLSLAEMAERLPDSVRVAQDGDLIVLG